MADRPSFLTHWLGRLIHNERAPRRIDSYRSPADIQSEQLMALSRQLESEKRRNVQLLLLNELSQQLETRLDQPVAAQLAVNTLERAIDCSFVCLLTHEPERREFVALASAGRLAKMMPPGYRQNVTNGILGRAARLRKTQISNNTPLDSDSFGLPHEDLSSSLVVPIIHNGHVEGMITIRSQAADAFHAAEVALVETVAAELERAWERSSYHQRLTELIRAGISLSTMVEPQAVVQEIATVTRQTLRARFVYATLLDQAGNLTQRASSGFAPKLQRHLERMPLHSGLFQSALNSSQVFRIRDVRKYPLGQPRIEIDQGNLRSLLVIPIRLHRLSIGSVMAFGKQNEIFFTENDESLASVLSTQSAAAVESTWLYQELRSTLTTTTQLYQVSFEILRTEELSQAAKIILETARKVASADSGGVVLFSARKKIEIELGIDANGIYSGAQHPFNLIQQAMTSGTSIFASDQKVTEVCFPIQTHLRKYGGLWLRISENLNYDSRHTAALQTLANQLERAILLIESRHQAKEIEAAYQELETTYDRTLAALMSALDARDRETEGHSARVSQLAARLGKELGLDGHQLKALERGALLHDIGKIGISDVILHKPGQLSETEWKIMRLHPNIGAKIVEDIPFLQDTLPIIRYHQERWDGSGYPIGLFGKDIPLMARIFSVVDAFDALTTERPYREKISAEAAITYLDEQAGVLFDPEVVSGLGKMFAEGRISTLQ
ncbi:MAG TPA: HD domain-containing phosphohydrolase [Anaerolineales bacterium]|nr:HD domain-containing phosphohydrolase [Anaerolineales bacterium]